MKKLVFALMLIIGSSGVASAQLYGSPSNGGLYGTGSNSSNHRVDGYTRQNGTYVAPHYQTNPNNTQRDNYGSQGNFNPYTGRTGTRAPRF